MILGFWSRKVYLDCLGVDVLGLNTTASNLFGFLNLAELGVGAAVLYFLYEPLNNNDYQTINKNVALQGWIYRRIAYLIIGGAFILMAFFPLMFKNMNLPMWYAYATFSVMLFSSMLGYFINYKSIVLNADQKGYKVTIATRGFSILIKVIEIIFLPLVVNPFVFTLFTSVISTIFGCLWLNHILKKEYPWLKTSGYKGKELLKELPGVLKKTKQLFLHKLSGVILLQLSPLIMYAFSSLAVIGCYGNYNTVLTQVSQVVQMVFASVAAGIGSLIATKDNQRIFRVFWELYDSRFCIISVTLVCVYFLIHPFFALWIGKQYIMGRVFLSLLIIESFIRLTRTTVDQYISGFGLFQDVWAPFAEMCINLIGAIGFGYLFGFKGVIMGNILSQLLIVYLWKPYMLFKLGINHSPKYYFIPVIKRHLLIVANVIGLSVLFNLFLPSVFSSYLEFFLYGLLIFIVVSILLWGEFCLFSQGMRDFNVRIISLMLKRNPN
jgi:O-antigen/teichoic acid export membrane protein